MGKIMLLLLTVASGRAAADWLAVGGNEEASIYVDKVSIVKSGNLVKMWDLFDFHSQQRDATGLPYLSDMSLLEYDCKQGKHRTLNFSYHSGNMGKGYIVYSDADTDPWQPVAAGSTVELLWRVACGKR